MEYSDLSSPGTNYGVQATSHRSFRFPANAQEFGHQSSSGAESSSKSPSVNFASSTRAATIPRNISEPKPRRRIRSAETDHLSEYFRSRPLSLTKGAVNLLNTTNANRNKEDDLREVDKVMDEFNLGAFSDEYDLAQEDPRILQDVQRALKMKARRESRSRGPQSRSPLKDTPTSQDKDSPLSTSSPSPMHIALHPTLDVSPAMSSTRDSSELDFSPSVGIVPLHPVPSSCDDGTTLDWTSSSVEDDKPEKRWGLPISKRRGKEKPPAPSMIEKQLTLYDEKLSRIRRNASAQTLRKATITGDQLHRRYRAFYNALNQKQQPLTLTNIVHWYADQDSTVKGSMEAAEPKTWLKHLDKRRKQPPSNFPWQVSALAVEEYAKRHARSETMATIPEVPSAEGIGISSYEGSPSPPFTPQTSPMRSRTSPHLSFGMMSSGRRSSDGHISFEPLVESTRNSMEGDYRSTEGASRTIRHLSSAITSSPHGSIYSLFSGNSSNLVQLSGTSPTSSRLHIREIANRIGRRRPPNDSDGASSAHDSLSEGYSRSDDGIIRRPKKDTSRLTDLELQTRQQPVFGYEYDGLSDGLQTHEPTAEEPSTAKAIPPEHEQVVTIQLDLGSPPEAVTPVPRTIRRRRIHISLPAAEQLLTQEKQKQKHERDEEKDRQEYDIKSQMLDDAIAQNQRIRHLLHRIGTGVREYESLRLRLMKFLGLPHEIIPQELLDAFNHDPSAVTGSTRRLRGWKAVEDIHSRINRQRETLRRFVSAVENTGISLPCNGVFEEPISALIHSLEEIEVQRQEISQKAQDVAGLMAKVKETHAVVKSEYNETLAHTSVIYPELSHIVALEESYKDQYQQFWELGMDALTFLLDTVTPFWRNYGKIIGEDVQDFLIIPLYRNEFTGEAKRYPLTQLPNRSFRHWMGLLLFACITGTLAFLQTRGAVSSVLYYRMPFITNASLWWLTVPFFWIGIIIQWGAVVIEFCIVFAELGIVIWWAGWSVKVFN